MSNTISSPIYSELLNLNLINKDCLKKISDETRDKSIPVYLDEDSKIIFLERYESNIEYYENNSSGNPEDSYFLKNKYYPDDYRRFKQFEKYIDSATHVLDYGCEWGGFLHLAKNKCQKISGIELNNDCLEFLKKNFIKSSFHKKISEIDDKPDLITSFHVLEHLPYQLQSLIEFRNALADEGKIIIEVPHAQDFLIQSVDLPEFRKFTFWSEHLVLHTKESLEALLKKAGFNKIEVFGYQRYGFTNHLGWFVDGTPNGHNRYKNLEDVKLDQSYKRSRVDSLTTDTLIAIATK